MRPPINYCETCFLVLSSCKQHSFHSKSIKHSINLKRQKNYEKLMHSKLSGDDLIEKSDQSIFYKKAKYISDCKHLVLQNGGKFSIDNIEYYAVNTCSIDYFLIIIYIIRLNHIENFNQIKNIEIGKVFERIYNYLSLNDWQKARIVWLEYCIGLEKIIKKNNVYDWFLSEYESFFVYFRSNQFYSWISKCDNISGPLCVNSLETTKHSYTYILK